MMKITLLFLALLINISTFAQSWSRMQVGPGEPGVGAVCTSPSGNVYISGYFSNPGDSTSYVLTWNGSAWIPVGTGIHNYNWHAYIGSLCTDPAGNIYAGGSLRNAAGKSYVAKWNGSTWAEAGTGAGALNAGGISALCADAAGNIYAACGTDADSAVQNVYKWDGMVWSRLGAASSALNANGVIQSICTDAAGNLYAGGLFSDTLSDSGKQYVAKWSGSSWSKLGEGLCYINEIGIRSVITDAACNVYAAGILGDTFGYNVMKWDGTSWNTLGTGSSSLHANSRIFTTAIDPAGNIYAAGQFSDSSYYTSNCYVAKWNGSAWSELGSGTGKLYPHSEIWTICADSHGNIYAGGNLTDNTGMGIVGRYGMAATEVAPLHDMAGVTVSPNPAHETITVKLEDKGADLINAPYVIYDYTGKIYCSGRLEQSTTINIGGLPAGIYLLQPGDNRKNCYRIIKN